MKNLTNMSIKRSPDGRLRDGSGLILVKKGDRGNWLWRYSFLKRKREMGLGKYPTVSLAEARKIRDHWAFVLSQGKDPIDVRRSEQTAVIEQRDRNDPTFEELIDIVHESIKDDLRDEGERGRWKSPLQIHLIPKVGKIKGSELTADHFVDAIRPIWKTKHPTALKAFRRTRKVLYQARLMGYPTDAFLMEIVRARLGVHHHKETKIPSEDWRDIPEIYQALPDTSSGNCNRWIILTMVRLESARGARVSEIDFDNATWTIPAERTKGRVSSIQDFTVPLPDECMRLVKMAQMIGSDLIFPSNRNHNKCITSEGVEKVLKTMGLSGRPHGFRSSFRTWVQETMPNEYEVAEMILQHTTNTKVVRSYARSDLLDQRRNVMSKWGDHVLGRGSTDKVVFLNAP